MNGQERAEANFLAFQQWVREKTEADWREMVVNGRLSRGEICRECKFGRSVLVQNPRVKEALHELEERLREGGVLPPLSTVEAPPPLRVKGQLQAATDAERLKRLEALNAALHAEVTDLRARLRRLEAVDAVLFETGRLPR